MGNGTGRGISILQIALLLKMEKHVSYDLRNVAVVQQQIKKNKVPTVLSTCLILYLLMLTNFFLYIVTHIVV
jgi:MFS superfamily sulfate permease-like transporter